MGGPPKHQGADTPCAETQDRHPEHAARAQVNHPIADSIHIAVSISEPLGQHGSECST